MRLPLDFLEQNLSAIKRHKPGLYADLKSRLSRIAPEAEYRLVELGDDWANLEIRGASGKSTFLYAGHPRDATKRAYELSPLRDPALIVVNGLGLGYHFLDLMGNKPAALRGTVVVERSPWIFTQALRLHDLTRYFADDDVEFCVGLDPAEFDAAVTGFLMRHGRVIFASRTGHFHFEPALAAAGPYYLAFAESVTRTVTRVKESFMAPGEDNFRALMNIVRNRNLLEERPAFAGMTGALEGLPAFLIGAGPSLGPELENLKRFRDRAVLAAVDAAVKPLLKSGIVPDLVVTTERVAVTRHLFTGLPGDLRTPLFALPSSHPDTLRAYPGPVIFLARAATFGAWLNPDAADDALPLGVTPAACVILRRLGCSEIALLGQDLSWPEGSDGYADGTAAFASGSARDAREILPCTVPGNSGADVPTTLGWKNALSELEALIPTLGIPCRHVIDSGRGARIRGAERADPIAHWDRAVSRRPVEGVTERLRSAAANAKPTVAPGTLQVLFETTARGLEDFIERACAAMQTMSADYHDRVNDRDAAAFRPEFADTLAHWRRLEEDLTGRDARLFYFFVNVLAGNGYVAHLSARESIPPDPERPVISLFHYLLRTADWARDAVAWAGRALHLLRSHAR